MSATRVAGSVSERYERVREVFESRVEELGAGGGALAVVSEGELVVDLWAGRAGHRAWGRTTRARLFSATKGIVTLAVARLVERGLIDVAAPVSDYWPEFARNGKAAVTVSHVLSHSAGLPCVPGHERVLKPNGEGWQRREEIVRRLESTEPLSRPGSEVMYHPLTWGWLVDELVRRVCGVSVGTLLREEIIQPLRLDAEFDLGTPLDTQRDLLAPLITESFEVWQATHNSELAEQRLLSIRWGQFFNNPAVMALELPAVNATGTARAIATVYGALATGGAIGNVRVLSQETIELFAAERHRGIDRAGSDRELRWALGFQRPMRPHRAGSYVFWGPHDEAFGHEGAGGQIGYADPVSRLGVGFLRSDMSMSSPLSGLLLDAVYDCVS